MLEIWQQMTASLRRAGDPMIFGRGARTRTAGSLGMSRWFSSLYRAVASTGGSAGPAAVIDARARYRGRYRSARHAVPAHQSSERRDVVALQLVPVRRRSDFESERNGQLLKRRMEWLSIAEGGFVAPATERPGRPKIAQESLADARRGACPEGDKPVRRGPHVVRARARPAGMSGSALRMGVRACAAILLAWERCEHLREDRLCTRGVRLVAGRGLAGGRAAEGADRHLHLPLRRTAYRRTVRRGRRKQVSCCWARVSGVCLP